MNSEKKKPPPRFWWQRGRKKGAVFHVLQIEREKVLESTGKKGALERERRRGPKERGLGGKQLKEKIVQGPGPAKDKGKTLNLCRYKDLERKPGKGKGKVDRIAGAMGGGKRTYRENVQPYLRAEIGVRKKQWSP